jgi:CheY-like chemotaxis protein
LRALVVDDEPDNVDSTAILLRFNGAEVHIARSGLAAIEAARATSPDVVFLDLAMPETDGYSVASALRAVPIGNDAVLVALTGYGDPAHKRRAAEVGFDLHLIKPIDWSVIEQLLAVVRETRGLHPDWPCRQDRLHAAGLELARARMDMVRTLLDVAATTASVETKQGCTVKAVTTCGAIRQQLQPQVQRDLEAELAALEKRAGELLAQFHGLST